MYHSAKVTCATTKQRHHLAAYKKPHASFDQAEFTNFTMASFEIGGKVQAVDPACGVWLPCTGEHSCTVHWTGFSAVLDSIVPIRLIRLPESRRMLKHDINVQDWPLLRHPENLERGDDVIVKRDDGSMGETFTVEFNDRFKCEVSNVSHKQHHVL